MIGPAETAASCSAILDELERAVVGRRRTLELVLVGILAGGHVLLEDLPGLGKTLIARSFARVLGLDFARIQFTPDLLPSDVVGASLYDQRSADISIWLNPLENMKAWYCSTPSSSQIPASASCNSRLASGAPRAVTARVPGLPRHAGRTPVAVISLIRISSLTGPDTYRGGAIPERAPRTRTAGTDLSITNLECQDNLLKSDIHRSKEPAR